jgi:hypothetical protein
MDVDKKKKRVANKNPKVVPIEDEDEILARVLKLSQETFTYDEETRRFIEDTSIRDKILADRLIIEEQKREYEQSLAIDREKERQKTIEKLPEDEDIPKTREELGEARLRYFTK